MFTLITQEEGVNYRDTLNHKCLIENCTEFFVQDEDPDNQYVVYNHKAHGVIVAAKISPSSADKPFLEKYFAENGYEMPDLWRVSDIFFSLSDDENVQKDGETFEKLCSQFYQGLRKVLLLIGKEKNIHLWATINSYEEHEDTKYFGDWEYVLEHGIYEDATNPNNHEMAPDYILGILKTDQIL